MDLAKAGCALALLLLTTPVNPLADQEPVLTDADVSDVVAQAINAAAPKFQREYCLVVPMRPSHVFATEDDGNWIASDDGGKISRYRTVTGPVLPAIPATMSAGWRTTQEEYGCADTLMLGQPYILEYEEEGVLKSELVVEMDRLCGPVCGDQHVVRFVMRDGKWRADGPPVFSGIAF